MWRALKMQCCTFSARRLSHAFLCSIRFVVVFLCARQDISCILIYTSVITEVHFYVNKHSIEMLKTDDKENGYTKTRSVSIFVESVVKRIFYLGENRLEVHI